VLVNHRRLSYLEAALPGLEFLPSFVLEEVQAGGINTRVGNV
jgi:hypothetical protein